MTFLAPTGEERAAWLVRIDEPGAHDDIARGLACLHEVEAYDPPASAPLDGWLRVAAWNVERGRHLDASLALLAQVDADVVLLSEIDVGMARSGNHDVPRRLADGLAFGGAFGVEFVELGIGDAADVAAADAFGATLNTTGLHGNAVLSRAALRDACVVRLDDGGAWFTASRGQPRVGGRMAVAGTIALGGTDVTVASFHLESGSTADERGAQMDLLLRALDERFGPDAPSVIGGDANTFGLPIAEFTDRRRITELRAAEPWRFSWPVEHEPLFEASADHGFAWIDANLPAPTTNHDARGLPDHVPLHLDWILVRGLEARRPTVVPAVDGRGMALSDHDLVALSVRLSP